MIPIYAGFWRRSAAFILDGIVLWVPNFLLGMVLPGSTAATFFAALFLGLAYYAGMHSSPLQATLGKVAFGIKVTDSAGKRLEIGAAVARYFATWLSAVILGVGFVLAAFTARKRALHDIICNTLVVNRDAQPEDMVEGNAEVMAVTWPVWAVVLLLFALPFGGGMAAAIAIPVYQDYTTRAQIIDAIARLDPIKDEIVEALTAKRPILPGTRALASPLVESVAVDPAGQLTLTFSQERLRGGKVFMAPVVAKTTRSEWRCWAEGVPIRFMPAVCKE
jgi:uncharacterized RDD family membrane protein YckC